MNDADRLRAQDQARRLAARSDHATRYSDAINRYLGTLAYRDAPAVRIPAAAPRPRPYTGVVIVGVDESPASYPAVDHAAVEAGLRGWDLRLVHVQYAGGHTT